MKARTWKSTDGKHRIVERFNKATAVSSFDAQKKSHHMWITTDSKLTASQVSARYGLSVDGKPEINEKEG